MIYHYTSVDTIHNILKKYRESKDKQHLELWASSIYLLNDPLEMLMAPNVITNVLKTIEQKLSIDDSYKLSKTFLNADAVKQLYLKTLEKDKYLFIISFSSNRDTLPMWSMYTKDGKGLCFCIDDEIIYKHFKEREELQTRIVPVSYNLTNLEDTTMRLLCDIYRNYIDEMKGDDIPDKDNLIQFYQYQFIRELAPLYKDSAYSYEGEKRLICTQQRHDDSIGFRISANGYVIPFRMINIPVDALKSIIVGPSYNYELLSEGLNMELILSGVKAKVEPSKVCYRAI